MINHQLAIKAGFGSVENYKHFAEFVGEASAYMIANELAYHLDCYAYNEFAKSMFNKIRTYYRYSTHKYPTALTVKQKDALLRVIRYEQRGRYYAACAYTRSMYSEKRRFKMEELAWELRNE